MSAVALRTIGVYSVQVLLLVSAAAAGALLIRSASPRIRLGYWRIIVLVCVLLPFTPPRVIEREIASGPVVTATILNAPAAIRSAASPSRLPAILVGILAFGVVVRLVWLAIGLVRLRTLRSQGTPAALDDDLRALHRTIAPAADVCWHDRMAQPVTFGIRRPVVLLPARARTLDPDLQRAVLCHELLHASRGDWLHMVVEECVRSILWFHPAIWWAIGRLQLSREETVDALAVVMTASRRHYMQALLAFADAPSSALTPAAAFARRRQLVVRIHQLSQEVVMSRSRVVVAIVAVSALMAGSGWTIVSAYPLRTEMRYRPAAPPPAASPSPARNAQEFQGKPITLAFGDADLKSVLRVFGDISGLKFDIEPGLEGKVDLDAKDMPWDEALDAVLKQHKLSYTVAGDTVRIRAAGMAAATPARSPNQQFQGQPIGLDFKNAELKSVLRVFSDISGLKFDIDPAVQGKVDISLKGVPWDQALDQLLKANNLSYSITGDTVRIWPAGVAATQGGGGNGAPLLTPVPMDGTTTPRLIYSPKPDYPAEAVKYNPTVTVWVTLKVGPSGEVTEAKASRFRMTIESPIEDPNYWASKPERAFMEASEAAALTWKFAPPDANTRTTIEALFSFRNTRGAPQADAWTVAPPPGSAAGGPKVIRVGGDVVQPLKIVDVKPVYPVAAQQARVQGVVILEAHLGVDGGVAEAKILRSIPLLDDAALAAVRQWRFTPTMLNGEPVEVLTTVTVSFMMTGQ